MSVMCKNGSCKAKRGMCGHEKTMMWGIMMAAVVGLSYWIF